MKRLFFGLMFVALSPTTSYAVTCQIYVNACPARPGFRSVGVLFDDNASYSSTIDGCKQRAMEWHDYCGTDKALSRFNRTLDFPYYTTCQVYNGTSDTSGTSYSTSTKEQCFAKGQEAANQIGGSARADFYLYKGAANSWKIINTASLVPTQYDMRTYWPTIKASEAMIRHWSYLDGAELRISKFYQAPGTNQFYNVDFTAMQQWEATWVMRIDPSRGVLEVSNQFPNNSGGFKNYLYETGGEILWGKNLSTPVNGQTQFVCQNIILAPNYTNIGYQCLGIANVYATHTFTDVPG